MERTHRKDGYMMAATRKSPIAYHGIEGVKFAPKAADGYAADFIPMPYAKNLGFTSLLEDAEVYSDNRLTLRVPNDKGYTIEFGSTGPNPELEKAAGYAIEGANGLVSANVVTYITGAVYYEFTEVGEDKRPYKVKVWAYEVEVGKGTPTHATDGKSIEFGEYKYPGTVYGATLMDDKGTKPYLDDLGMGRTAFMYYARPGDDGYATFGDAVPVPKVKAAAPAVD